MQAIIIAGGKGTRLRPLTLSCPKPMLPLLQRPYLEWLVWRCTEAGITNILLNVHYHAEQVMDYFGDGSRFSAKIGYVVETEPLDTAGAILLAKPQLTGETLIVFNADILTDLDLRQLIQFHRQQNADATLTLTRVPDVRPFGLVELAGDRIVRFHEKPSPHEAEVFLKRGIDTVNAGTYILEPKIFQHYTANQPLSFERVVFPHTLERGYKMQGFVWQGYWLDLGTPAKYVQGQCDILLGKLGSAWFDLTEDAQQLAQGVWVSKTATVSAQASLSPPCFVGSQCILGDQAVIPSGSIIGADSIIDRAIAPGLYGAKTILI